MLIRGGKLMQNVLADSTAELNPDPKTPVHKSGLIFGSLLTYHAPGSLQVEQTSGTVV